MKTALITDAIDAVHAAILAHESEIESLDRAIGDGDHFVNLKRGLSTLVAMREELLPLAPDAALQKMGMKLLSTIGGASGPLFASFFMAMAASMKAHGGADKVAVAAAFSAGVESIKQRGKAGLGEKTMLDVLIPVAATFSRMAAEQAAMPELLAAIQASAEAGMLSTRDLVATKGRAAFLGERAIGHIDAGAKSTQVMINAVCRMLEH